MGSIRGLLGLGRRSAVSTVISDASVTVDIPTVKNDRFSGVKKAARRAGTACPIRALCCITELIRILA